MGIPDHSLEDFSNIILLFQHHSSFSASFAAHSQGAIYTQIMDVQPFYSTTVTLSGSGNTGRTGKSLMTSMWQIVFIGHKPVERIMKVTESTLYNLLSEGTTIYCKYYPTQFKFIYCQKQDTGFLSIHTDRHCD